MSRPPMRIEGLAANTILGRLAGYLPMVIVAGLMYWVFIGAAFVLIASQWFDLPAARVVGATTAGVLVVGGMVAYVRFVARRLSKCVLEIDNYTLTVRSQRAWSFAEVQIPLNRIRRVVFGQPLNRLERLLDKLDEIGVPKTSMAMNKDLKAGQLLVQTTDDTCTVFHFVDIAFDENDLAKFFVELKRRGLAVETAT